MEVDYGTYDGAKYYLKEQMKRGNHLPLCIRPKSEIHYSSHETGELLYKFNTLELVKEIEKESPECKMIYNIVDNDYYEKIEKFYTEKNI